MFDEEVPSSNSPEIHAIWWLLGGQDSRIVQLNGLGAWRAAVSDAIADLEREGTVIFAWDGGLAAWVRRVVTGRGWSNGRSPSSAEVREAILAEGAIVRRRYMIWPSVLSPRVAMPASETEVLRWAHRSGVLGGGGGRLWLRSLARSPLLAPIIRPLIPGKAVLARRGGDDD